MTDEKRNNRLKGIIVSLLLNGLLLAILMLAVLPAPPPPEETEGILIELLEEYPPRRIVDAGGANPQRTNNPGNRIEVAPPEVRPSDRTRASRPDNRPDAKPSTAGDEGDVERYEPLRPQVNPQALFQSNNTGTEELDNKTNIKDNSLFPGTGTSDDPTRGTNATPGSFTQQKGVDFSLAGRSASGRWPLPEYKVQKEGRVVVEITVDRQGKVIRAVGGVRGSTTADARLVRAAEEAAKKAMFNADPKAANLQVGTITYIFRLE
ncbi:MAG: TonB family protein [Prevotellaceae bacterium]|jgi:TonB family protein|nr:TonB family protein [Prevotellaceae bacterium]